MYNMLLSHGGFIWWDTDTFNNHTPIMYYDELCFPVLNEMMQ